MQSWNWVGLHLVGFEWQKNLVDFGFARLLPNNSLELNTPCFTLEYAAPEVLEIEDDILPQYNQQCDLWSIGKLLQKHI